MNDAALRAALQQIKDSLADAFAAIDATGPTEPPPPPPPPPSDNIPSSIPGFARVVTMRADWPTTIGPFVRVKTIDQIPGGFRPTDALIVPLTMPAGRSVLQLGWVYDSGMGSWIYNLSRTPGEMTEGPGTVRGAYGRTATGIGAQFATTLSSAGPNNNAMFVVDGGKTYYFNVSYRDQSAPQKEGYVSLKIAG